MAEVHPRVDCGSPTVGDVDGDGQERSRRHHPRGSALSLGHPRSVEPRERRLAGLWPRPAQHAEPVLWRRLDRAGSLPGYRAAVTRISTRYFGAARRASTQARAGVFPGLTHASQTSFISAKKRMSESQMVAVRILDLSVPARSRRASTCSRIRLVCSLAVGAASPST